MYSCIDKLLYCLLVIKCDKYPLAATLDTEEMEREVLKIVASVLLFSIILTTADIYSDLKLIYEFFTGGFVTCNVLDAYDKCFEGTKYFPHAINNSLGEEIVCNHSTFKEQCSHRLLDSFDYGYYDGPDKCLGKGSKIKIKIGRIHTALGGGGF